ncbi:hypothetical protein TVAG_029180 [Trichomonas vaginalis G3]|uniref:Uncharacterized protein n=1 Tax=Trichomonas vaginalis (strain ATCC PRA-98 / G3) TaxID=412133 RepID=A2F510_TRIV3|nr:hypothetical protein TVAGG3_0594650 [Trichomonas vaginalis G3]EAY00014.1 hypothetical protein TVAG_029180 [Trichomonas vaginalis G3]KAI5523515.1 hypothetical protein TVAGG3_0594650 [Trichomonas vaginalis G3]|eukprot:XP_001312943.1 hypothetical protein [Trichomonas vaginalis G3]
MSNNKRASRMKRMNDEQMRTIKTMLSLLDIDINSNYICDFLGLDRKHQSCSETVNNGLNEVQNIISTTEELLPLYNILKEKTEELEDERKRVREYIEKAEEYEREMEKINQEKAELIAKMQQPESQVDNTTMNETNIEDVVADKQTDLASVLNQKKSEISSLEAQIYKIKYQINALDEDIKILSPNFEQ